MPRFRHRSSSVGSYSDAPASTTTTTMGTFPMNVNCSAITDADLDMIRSLLLSILYLKDASGKSFLHSQFNLTLAKALLDRARSLDELQATEDMQRRFLLQKDRESGYTPLH